MRLGFWKQGSSRRKWKPPMVKGQAQQIKVRLSPDPEIYDIAAPPAWRGAKVGAWRLDQVDCDGGIVSLSAMMVAGEAKAEDILSVLKLAYTFLQRKQSGPAAAAPNAPAPGEPAQDTRASTRSAPKATGGNA